ncbi:MAG: hypothetical protein HYX92_15935 [Chloroflexi bacterium]|nr:hypothetical protein [Chloroflexota bacterium]
MLRKKSFVMVSCFMILGLLAPGCAREVGPPAASKAVVPPAASATAITRLTPKPAEPSPAPKPAAEQPRYGGTLTGWASSEPEHLDIHQAASGGSLYPLAAVYDGLIQYNPMPPYDIIADLAESWEIGPDGKSYLFNLQRGVKWHDGLNFTSEDAKFSLERMVNPQKGTRSPRQQLYAPIAKVEAVGQDKVRVSLDHPSASLLAALAWGWTVMMPKHVIEARGDMKNHAIGTGPFRFQAYVAGSHLAMKRNSDYFVKGRPYVDGITWYVIKDRAVQLAAFRTKKVLMTAYGSGGFDPLAAEIVKKEIPGVVVFEYPGPPGGGASLTFNVTRPPFNDVRARQAAVLALDQGAIIEVALRGGGKRTGPLGGTWAMPEQELLALPGVRQPRAADFAEAKKLLAEAGYPNGIKTRLPLRTGGLFSNIAVVVTDQLSKIGIALTPEPLEAVVFNVTQRQRNWDLMMTSQTGRLDDPDTQLSHWITDSPDNFSGFTDKLVDDLYAKQSQEMNSQERKRIVSQLQRRLIEQMPVFRFYEPLYIFAHWPDLKGFPGVGAGIHNNVRWAHVWLSQ